MASLYKPLVLFHRTADGRRCRKGTPGVRLHCGRARLWYGAYQDARGGWHRVPLDPDEDSARRLLEDLLRRDHEAAGPPGTPDTPGPTASPGVVQ